MKREDHWRNVMVDGPYPGRGKVIAHNCANRESEYPLLGQAEGCCVPIPDNE